MNNLARFLGLAFLASGSAIAADSQSLEQITVYGTAAGDPALGTDLLTQEELRRFGRTTLDEAWNDPVSPDTTLSSFCPSFEFDRAYIADSRMPSIRIVEPFDVIEHIGLGLFPRPVLFPVNSFLLQRAKEALHGRVVPDIA